MKKIFWCLFLSVISITATSDEINQSSIGDKSPVINTEGNVSIIYTDANRRRINSNHESYKLIVKLKTAISEIPDLQKNKKTLSLHNEGIHFYDFNGGGMKNAYGLLSSVIDYDFVRNQFKGEVYIKGPHQETLNLSSSSNFGHYNPLFIKWFSYNINKVINDKEFVEDTRNIIHKNLVPTFLEYYYTYKFLHKKDDLYEKLHEDYYRRIKNKSLPENYIWQTSMAQVFDAFGDLWSNKDDIDKFMEIATKDKKLAPYAPMIMRVLKSASNSDHILIKDKGVTRDLRIMFKQRDVNIITPAIYFWIRRDIDGTSQEIFDILSSILGVYGDAEKILINQNMRSF